MEVRRLTPADYDSFYGLRLAGLEEFPITFATDAQAWRSASKETIERLLVNSYEREDTPILGAWEEGELVGMVGLNRDLRPSVAHKSTLWGFYVAANYRQQGVGLNLLNELFSLARTISGLRQMRAVVNVENEAALKLLMKVGFEQFGREPDAKKVNGILYDQIYLWYRLMGE